MNISSGLAGRIADRNRGALKGGPDQNYSKGHVVCDGAGLDDCDGVPCVSAALIDVLDLTVGK